MLVASAAKPTRRPAIKPQIPTANRSAGNRVFLEHADVLNKLSTDEYMVVSGNVVFSKGPMIMKCDSAHYYQLTESMDAFGHVSMEQGDTLFVYADELNYNGVEEIAYLYADYGKKVRMINRDVKLETDEFVYDLRADLGYYTVGGVLTDPKNVLTSVEGEYVPSTKEANFYVDVHLNSRSKTDTLDIYSDTLYYNTNTHVAELYSPSEVVNARGIIYTDQGTYDTNHNLANLYNRSTVVSRENHHLTADTIMFDHEKGYGEAFGNVVMRDSTHQAEAFGDYGFYNELTDSTFITGHAELREYRQEDTLYVHGRYIETFRTFDTIHIEADSALNRPESIKVDTTHVSVIYPRVRFFRTDMQGVCDSMRMTQRDSTMRMYINPVVWNDEQQIFGNIIEVEVNDSTIKRAILPDQGFAAQAIEGDQFNQLSGKKMIADFEEGNLRRLFIDGNVEIIMYPEENDSTINKMVNAESSYLEGWFKGRTTERIKLWPETTGTVTPMFMARKALYYLPKFKWFESIRPTSREDIFVIPKEMDDIMDAARKPQED
jgi:lipopolysaccharide export system protein LptA